LERREKKYCKSALIRFYAELNDFLPQSRKQKCFRFTFKGYITVKDAIESLGIPHSEVDLVLVNSVSVDFAFRLKEDDYISVYPVFECFDISSVTKNGKKPLRNTRFIADAHLGKLAKYLRMLGFDTLYEPDIEDSRVISIASKEKRIILTRDKSLLKSSDVDHGYYVRSISYKEQLSELILKFDLVSQMKPFSRCIVCNHSIFKINKSEILARIKNDTRKAFNEFYCCAKCDRIYWKGSHYERMKRFVLKFKE